MLIIGVIGPIKSIKQVEKVVNESFTYINVCAIEYLEHYDVIDLVRKYEKEIDALLFTGTTPYRYASAHHTPLIPWAYIPRETSSLLSTLLAIAVTGQYFISKISIDSYNAETVYETYLEAGFAKEDLSLSIAEERVEDDAYIDYLTQFHKENFVNYGVSCCVTGIESVYKALIVQGVPCYKISHSSNVIRETILKLRLKHLLNIGQVNRIVVLSIEIDPVDEQSILFTNEYQMAIEKMKVAEQVYLYAHRIEAAVVEIMSGRYLLFTTKNSIDTETDQLRNIDLLHRIQSKTKCSISIGIGFGRTTREAKYGATIGKDRAQKSGGNCIYVVYEGEKVVGPIDTSHLKNTNSDRIDEKYLLIAEKSSLGKNTIFKLYSIVKQYKIETITPKELARLYGVSLRSMNRIIESLEQNGFVKTVGKKSYNGVGRPSRLIRFLFD